jgi:hypothetical protein
VELLAGFADGEAAANVQYGHIGGLANIDLHGDSFGHDSGLARSVAARQRVDRAARIIRRQQGCSKKVAA